MVVYSIDSLKINCIHQPSNKGGIVMTSHDYQLLIITVVSILLLIF